MDCEGCTDRLIDLLDEELDDAEANTTRAHLATCERCAATFERVSAGYRLGNMLSLEEPPPNLLDGVLAAARERAAVRISANPEASLPLRPVAREAREPSEEDEDDAFGASFVRWLGSFAMRPQAAMAMSLLLMVGIGLWYLPDWRGIDPTDNHAVIDPAVGDDARPSAGLVPAEPLALEEDARRARIRPRTGEDVASERTQRRRARRAESDGPETPAPRRAQRVAPPAAAPAVADETGDELLAQNEAQAVPPEAVPSGATPSQALGVGTLVEDPAPSARPTMRAPPSAAILDEGIASAGGASAELDTPELLPPALHQMARNQALANRCAQAIPSYRRLLSEYPSYPRASEARVELADCYRRTGQLSNARRALEQASSDPRTATRARRELVRLEAAERALDRPDTDRTPDLPARRSREADVEAADE